MAPSRPNDEFELHSRPRRSPSSSHRDPPPPEAFDDLDDDSDDDDSHNPDAGLLGKREASKKTSPPPPGWVRWLFNFPRSRTQTSPRGRRWRRRCCQCSGFFTTVWLVIAIFTIIFRPSYTKKRYPEAWARIETAVAKGGGLNPEWYWKHLPGEGGVNKTTIAGRGNPDKERIFIAANIVDAELIKSEWGSRVMELMDLLGEENVFLSIFENDSGPETKAALKSLDHRIEAHMPKAGRSIVSTTLPFSGVPRVQLPGGETFIKRITYLAEVRNRALLPLLGSIPSLSRWNQTAHPKSKTPTHEAIGDWEVLHPIPESGIPLAPAMPPSWVPDPKGISRILFLNDVVFDPTELLHLLFSTNAGDYAAACATDYINPFKYYDTFATRDPDGFPLGVPFFPFFATPVPRALLLSTAPEIPVRSCWGGAVAFNATPFLRPTNPTIFRSEKEPFWDASECCLIHADIAQPERTFMNPFVRVAYTPGTFDWLPFARRVERVFSLPHWALVRLLRMPWEGERRTVEEGETVWVREELGGERVQRTVGKGGYCGSRKLLVMREGERKAGEKSWRGLPVPDA